MQHYRHSKQFRRKLTIAYLLLSLVLIGIALLASSCGSAKDGYYSKANPRPSDRHSGCRNTSMNQVINHP